MFGSELLASCSSAAPGGLPGAAPIWSAFAPLCAPPNRRSSLKGHHTHHLTRRAKQAGDIDPRLGPGSRRSQTGSTGRRRQRTGGVHSKARSPAGSVSDRGYGRPPHPLRVQAGSATGLAGLRVGDHSLSPARRVTMSSSESAPTARGSACGQQPTARLNYSFLGWEPRRYRTWAIVVALDDVSGDRRAVRVGILPARCGSRAGCCRPTRRQDAG